MLFPLWANPTNNPVDEVGGPNYLTPEGVMAWSNNIALGRLPIPADCTVRKFIVQLGNGPGEGRWWIFEYFVNGVAVESTQVKVEGTAKEGKWSGELKLKEGDTLQVRAIRGGSGGGSTPGLGIEGTTFYTWIETTGNIFFVGGGGNGNLKTGEASYNPPFGVNSAGWQAVEGDTRIVVPGNFTLKALAVDLSGTPGAGKSYALSGRVNRTVDVLTAKIEGAAATTALAKGSAPVKAGETLETKCVPAGTPSGRISKYCFAIEAENPGEIFAAGMDAGADSPTATQYSYPDTWKLSWTAAESNGRLPRPIGLKFERFYVQIGVAPGALKSRTYALRMNGATQALQVKIEGEAKSGNDTTHSFTTDGSRLALQSEPSVLAPEANTGGVRWGFVVIVPQPQSLVLGKASEVDTAGSLPRRKSRTIGQAVETDVSSSLVKAKTRLLGQAVEVEIARPITVSKSRALGQAAEVEQAQALGKSKALSLGQAIETEQAEALIAFKAQEIGQAVEVDTAPPISVQKARQLQQASETSEAKPITAFSGGTLGQASEADYAFPLVLRIGYGGTASVAEESAGGAIVAEEPMGSARTSEEP